MTALTAGSLWGGAVQQTVALAQIGELTRSPMPVMEINIATRCPVHKQLTLDEDVQVDGKCRRDTARWGDLVTAVGGSSLLITAGSVVVGMLRGRLRSRLSLVATTVGSWGRGSHGPGSEAEDGGDNR